MCLNHALKVLRQCLNHLFITFPTNAKVLFQFFMEVVERKTNDANIKICHRNMCVCVLGQTLGHTNLCTTEETVIIVYSTVMVTAS